MFKSAAHTIQTPTFFFVGDLNTFSCANHGDAERGRAWERPTGPFKSATVEARGPLARTNLRSRYRALRSTTHDEATPSRVFQKCECLPLVHRATRTRRFRRDRANGGRAGAATRGERGGYGIPRWIDALLHSSIRSSIRRGEGGVHGHGVHGGVLGSSTGARAREGSS